MREHQAQRERYQRDVSIVERILAKVVLQPVDEYLQQCEFEYGKAIRPPPQHHWGLRREEAYLAIVRVAS